MKPCVSYHKTGACTYLIDPEAAAEPWRSAAAFFVLGFGADGSGAESIAAGENLDSPPTVNYA